MKKKELKLAFILNVLLCSVFMIGCEKYDDGIDMKSYRFSQNNVTIDNKASRLSVSIENADRLGAKWSIVSVTLTDDTHRDESFENEWVADPSSEYGNKILSPVFKKEWFDVRYTDAGSTLLLDIAPNTGGERKLSVYICDGLGGGYGIFELTQKAGK